MRVPIRLGSAIAVAAAGLAAALPVTGALSFATPAFASTAAPAFGSGRASHAVFVQTDNTSGNQVVAYHRASGGTLSPAGTYATGGLGGVLAGSVVDHLASQGSLSYDPWHTLLYAVNAGERHRLGLRRARRPARAAPGTEFRRFVPGQRGRTR